MNPIQFLLPMKVSTNTALRANRYKRNDMVHEFHKAILPFKGLKIYTPVQRLFFTFSFKGKLLDCSNCSFMQKCIEDAMVLSGLLPNDTPEYVQSIAIASQKGKKDEVSIAWL